MSLIKDIQSDLDSAAVRIVGEYRARLHAAAVKLCGDAGEADDLVMRTFDAAFRETSSYDETKGELYPWLVGVLHRIHARSNRRLVDRGTVPVDPAVLQDLAGATEDSINKVLEDSDHDALRAAMERLDPEYKRVLVMHYFGELPVKQIATVMNMPVGTVLWRLSIARKILARDLGEKLGKKPVAVLLAILLGIGSLFGAWKAAETIWPEAFSSAPEAELATAEDPLPQQGEEPLAAEEALPTVEPEDEEPSAADTAGEAAQAEPPPATDLKEEQVTQEQVNTKKTEGEETMGAKKLMMAAVAAVVGNVLAGNTLNVPSNYATIADAVAVAGDGDEIVLAASDTPYALTANLTVPSGVTLRGATGDRDDVTVSGDLKFAVILSANSSARDLTFSSMKCSSDYGVDMKSGSTMDNCRVTGCVNSSIYFHGGVYNEGGTVSNTLIENNESSQTRAWANGYHQTAGLIRNSVIRNNQMKSGMTATRPSSADGIKPAAAVTLQGGDMVNCLVTRNRLNTHTDASIYTHPLATGIYVAGASKVINCLVTGNTYSGEDTGRFSGICLINANARVENCVILENGNISGAVVNIEAAKCAQYANCGLDAEAAALCADSWEASLEGDFVPFGESYRIMADSPLVDSGKEQDAALVGAKDLNGGDRVRGTAIDIGPFEYQAADLACMIRTNVKRAFDRLTDTARAVVTGPAATGLSYAWYLDGEAAGTDETLALDLTTIGSHTLRLVVTNGGGDSVEDTLVLRVCQGTIEVDAAEDIQSAIDSAEPGASVALVPGEYQLTETIYVRNGVTLRGKTGSYGDVTLIGGGTAKPFVGVSLSGTGSTLSSLTVKGCAGRLGNANDAGGVLMDAGTVVTNCRVTANITRSYVCKGAGIQNHGGLVTHSLIDGNHNDTYDRADAVGYYQEYGQITHSRITGNYSPNIGTVKPSPSEGFRWTSMGFLIAGGRMDNCYVAGNYITKIKDQTNKLTFGLGGTATGTARIINTMIINNTYAGDTTTLPYGVRREGSATFENCVILDNGSTDGSVIRNIIGDENFINCASDDVTGCTGSMTATMAGDFRADEASGLWKLLSTSPLVDTGYPEPEIEGGTDLLGQPRLDGYSIDIGPFEYQMPVIGCTIFLPSFEAFDRLTATAESAVSGSKLVGLTYAWYLDEEPLGIETTQAIDLTEPGIYTLRLVVTNDGGDTAEDSVVLTVRQSTYEVSAVEDIQPTIDSIDPGCSVALAPGEYQLTGTIYVRNGVTLRGKTGNYGDVTLIGGGTAQPFVGVSLSDAGSTLSSLTVTGCAGRLESAADVGGVLMGANTVVTNCRVTANITRSYVCRGAGIQNRGGLVTHSLIDGNHNDTRDRADAVGYYQESGRITHSRIVGNYSPSIATVKPSSLENLRKTSMGFYLAGGQMDNCYVAGNQVKDLSDTVNSLVVGIGGTAGGMARIVNTMIIDNTYSGNTTVRAYGVAREGSATFENCVILDNGSADGSVVRNIIGDANFINCASDDVTGCTDSKTATMEGDFRADEATGLWKLLPTSPLVDAGYSEPQIEGGTDIFNLPRLDGPAIDIGPSEFQTPVVGCTIILPKYEAFDRLVATAESVIVGSKTAGLTYAWYLDDEPLGTEATQAIDLGALGRHVLRLVVRNGDGDENEDSVVLWVRQGTYEVNTVEAIQPAIDNADPGAAVALVPGEYQLTETICVRNGVTLKGKTGNPDDVVLLGGGSSKRFTGVSISDTGSTLSSLTVKNCYGASWSDSVAGGVIMSVGTVLTNCHVTANATQAYRSRGSGVRNVGGLVTCCLIDRNHHDAERVYAVGYYQEYGTIRNTQIVSNYCGTIGTVRPTGEDLYRAAMGFYLTGGRMENCYVAGNYITAATDSWNNKDVVGIGGTAGGTARVINSMIVGNTYGGTPSFKAYGVRREGTATFENCVVLDNGSADGTVVQNLVGDASFDHCAADDVTDCTDSIPATYGACYRRDRKTGLLKHMPGSPLIDKGKSQPDLEAGVDLVLRPRLHGKAIDIGPFECPGIPGFGIILR